MLATVLKKLLQQVAHPLLRSGKRLTAESSSSVQPPNTAILELLPRAEESLLLQCVQDWIDGSGTEAITVASQLLDHLQSKDRLAARVMQNVEGDQPAEQAVIVQSSRCRSHGWALSSTRRSRFCAENHLSVCDNANRSGASITPVRDRSHVYLCAESYFSPLSIADNACRYRPRSPTFAPRRRG